MIVRELIGLAAITVSAIVPLFTARVVLGVIVGRMQSRRSLTKPLTSAAHWPAGGSGVEPLGFAVKQARVEGCRPGKL